MADTLIFRANAVTIPDDVLTRRRLDPSLKLEPPRSKQTARSLHHENCFSEENGYFVWKFAQEQVNRIIIGAPVFPFEPVIFQNCHILPYIGTSGGHMGALVCVTPDSPLPNDDTSFICTERE